MGRVAGLPVIAEELRSLGVHGSIRTDLIQDTLGCVKLSLGVAKRFDLSPDLSEPDGEPILELPKLVPVDSRRRLAQVAAPRSERKPASCVSSARCVDVRGASRTPSSEPSGPPVQEDHSEEPVASGERRLLVVALASRRLDTGTPYESRCLPDG